MSRRKTADNTEDKPRTKPRNLFLRVSDGLKLEAKALADQSGMTLEGWCVCVLRDAAAEKALYRPVKVSSHEERSPDN